MLSSFYSFSIHRTGKGSKVNHVQEEILVCSPIAYLCLSGSACCLHIFFPPVQFRNSVMSDSVTHGQQNTRLPCPSPTPGAYSNSCPSNQWCCPTIPSTLVPFSSCLQSSPASGSFPFARVSCILEWRGLSSPPPSQATVLPVLEVREEGFEGQMSLENEWGQVLCFLVDFGLSVFTWMYPD